MNEKTNTLLAKAKGLALPFLLAVSLSLATYGVYGDYLFSIWTVGVLIVTAVTFGLCLFTEKHHLIGGVLFWVVIHICFMVFFRLTFGNDWGETFQRWLLTASEDIETNDRYLAALLISFVPFYGAVVYYFSEVLYRMMFLTLLSIVPFALYVKTLTSADNFFIAVIALLNVLLFLAHVRRERGKVNSFIGSPAQTLSAAVFTVALLIVSAGVPKQSEAIFYDRFEELFMDSNFTASLNADYTNFSDFSGGPDLFRNFANRRLYTLNASTVPYFKRQTFDIYDYGENTWTNADGWGTEPYYTPEEFTEHRTYTNLAMLQSAIKRGEELSPGFASKYGLKSLAEYESLPDSTNTVIVSSENFGAMYYLSPARVVNVRNYLPGETPSVTRTGVYRLSAPHPNDFAYAIEYYDEFFSRRYFLSLGGASMTDEQSGEMLEELLSLLTDTGDEGDSVHIRCVSAYLAEMQEAEEYEQAVSPYTEEIPDSVKELALEITAGDTYDWEKANSLSNYFLLNGYRYDLEYIAPDDSVEYFLFTSKRGSCTHYATAFVLMARAAGLNARYDIGYTTDLSSRENTFIIKDSNSHAFPEVYIQNMGWVVFEPTVPSEYAMTETADNTGGGLNLTMDTSLVSVVLTVVGIFFAGTLAVVLLMPLITGRYREYKLRRMDPAQGIRSAYALIQDSSTKVVRKPGVKTPFELTSSLSEITGEDETPLAYTLEDVVYGEQDATEESRDRFVDKYIAIRKAIGQFVRRRAREERKKYR